MVPLQIFEDSVYSRTVLYSSSCFRTLFGWFLYRFFKTMCAFGHFLAVRLVFGHFRQISDSTVQFRTLLSNLELSSDFGGFRRMELGRQVVSEKSSWIPDYDVSNVE